MNRKVIIFTVGKMIEVEGLLMLLPALTGFLYHESQAFVYLLVATVLFVLGRIISLKKPKNLIISKNTTNKNTIS